MAQMGFIVWLSLMTASLMAGCTAALLPHGSLDLTAVMRDDISRIKVMMETVGERMERFNDLYLNKLEMRLLTSATSMAHIDSNVKNLQERAHVWDTFQLHVSAWNEQIKSLDKKLDILNRGAEKWELLDEKVVSLLPLDYKLNKLMAKLEETDAKVSEIQRKLNTNCSGHPILAQQPSATSSTTGSEVPLFSEFTSRGVLSALKDIEVKVNRIAEKTPTAGQVSSSNSRKEDLQQKTLDVVNDVAGKVDFILDKMVVKRHSGGGHKQQAASTEEAVGADDTAIYDDDSDYPNPSEGQAERSFAKLWRRMLQPVRRANRKFESLDKVLSQLERVANASVIQQRRTEDKLLRDDVASALECCRGNDVALRGLIKTIELLAGRTMPSCVEETDLQMRLQQTQTSVVRQLSDLVKEQIGAGVERVRQTCGALTVQRRKTAYGNWTSTTHVEESDLADVSDRPETSTAATTTTTTTTTTTPAPTTTTTEAKKIGLRGCHDLRAAGETESKVYSLASGKELNEGGRDYNTRFCDMTTDGGGWTVIQRRGDFIGDVVGARENFSVGWKEYKLGFGDIEKEFWFGNDFIHRLTNEHDVVLRVELWDFDNQSVFAEYESFRVDSEEDLYRLWVEGYQGNATDSLGSHNGYAFSTFDRDNDEAPPCCPCAPAYGGGWWFYSCFEANLNGEYHTNPIDNDYYRGIIWELWRGDYSLRRAEMKIRPHDFVPPRSSSSGATPTTPTTSNSTIGLDLDDVIPEDP